MRNRPGGRALDPPADDGPCEVRSGGNVVRYRRAGTGSSVLLLGDDASGGTWPGLDAAVSQMFRLIVPEIGSMYDLRERLPDFLEGLGGPAVCVIAGPAFCAYTADLIALEAEQMARTVIVAADDATARDLDAFLAQARPRVPVLLLHRGIPAEAALPAILRFIAGMEQRPPG